MEIDHSGHFPFFEQPEATATVVLNFTRPEGATSELAFG